MLLRPQIRITFIEVANPMTGLLNEFYPFYELVLTGNMLLGEINSTWNEQLWTYRTLLVALQNYNLEESSENGHFP